MAEQSNRKTIEEQLKELGAEIADLLRRIESGVDKEVEALRPRLKVAREKFDELTKTSAEAWGDLKPGLGRAWNELHKSLNEAAARFKSDSKK